MYRYRNNTFRVLGLLPTSSMSEIMSRVNEIKIKKSLGTDIAYDCDFLWMGALDRNEENVIGALQRLEDSVARLKEEMFWFWVDRDEDKRALHLLTQGNRQEAHNIWKDVLNGKEPNNKTISAYVNQLILAHSSVIGRECLVKYYDQKEGVFSHIKKAYGVETSQGSKKRDSKLDELHWKNWRFVLDRLSRLNTLDCYWQKIEERAKRLNDPRLSESKMQEFREQFLSEIAEVNFSFISQALVFKDYERIRQHSSLLNGMNLPSIILKQGFNRTLAFHINSINRSCEAATREINTLGDGISSSDISAIRSKLIQQIKEFVDQGKIVDINLVSDFALARDNVAKVLRSIAIILNNKFHDYAQALFVINEAIDNTGSSYVKERFEKDKETISRNMTYGVISETISTRSRKVPLAKLSSLKNLFHNPFSFVNWRNFVVSWKGFLIWGGIILFLIISSSGNNSSSTSSRSSHSSSYSTSSETERLSQEINSNKIKLATSELIIKGRQNKLSSLKSELENLDMKYKYVTYVPQNIVDYYNSKVEEYNSLSATAKREYEEYESLLNETNAEINRYNELVKGR